MPLQGHTLHITREWMDSQHCTNGTAIATLELDVGVMCTRTEVLTVV